MSIVQNLGQHSRVLQADIVREEIIWLHGGLLFIQLLVDVYSLL